MNKIKLLVLDDNDLQRVKTEQVFSSLNEYEIIASTNDGLEGYNIICEQKPDILITDIVLQNYDGFELLEKIKNLKDNKVKILVLSSLKGEDFAQSLRRHRQDQDRHR